MNTRSKLLATATAIALAVSTGAVQAEGKLSLYNWFEYIPQDLLVKFSKEYDVEVTMDTYDSNETMLTTLKAGKMGTYDVAVPSDYMVAIMGAEGMLDTFEPSELSNFGNIKESWMNVSFDMGRHSSVPFQVGSTSFSVNRDVYKGDINSLELMFNPPAELAGKINALDSQGEVLLMASMYLGIPQCSTDREQLKALNAMLQSAKENWASISSDIAKDALVSGDVAAGMIWSGYSAKARAEGANIEYAFPKEGLVVWMDNVVLLKQAPNRDNAIKFLNFLLEPENAAAITNFAQYGSGVTGAYEFLTEEVKNLPEANTPAGIETHFVQTCDEDVQEVYNNIWINLKK